MASHHAAEQNGAMMHLRCLAAAAALLCSTGALAIELDGIRVGWVQSSALRASGPVALNCGAGAPREITDWIKGWAAGALRKDLSIEVRDAAGKVSGHEQLTGALITEIGLPALDASSKDAAHMTLQLTSTSRKLGPPAAAAAAPAKGPKWLASGFRLRFDGVAAKATASVQRISAIALRPRQASRVTLELPSSQLAAFDAWKKAGGQRRGSLEYVSSDGKSVYCALKMMKVHLASALAQPRATAATPVKPLGVATSPAMKNSKDAVARVEFELYLESLDCDGIRWG
jgi:hypothetical protein